MTASPGVRPFAFDRIFAASTARKEGTTPIDLEFEADRLRQELGQISADRDAALAQARKDGFDAGLTQARQERDTAVLAACDALHASLEQFEDEVATIERGLQRESAALALAAGTLLAARATELAPVEAIDEALGRALQQVGRGPRMLIRVHPELGEAMNERVAARVAGERRRMSLSVVADPTLALGDAAIVWDEGSLSLDAAARHAAVTAEMAQLLG
jgi:flagellar assembly protein FliH